MGNFVEQSTLNGTRPVIYNVCNYQKPVDGQPALLLWDDVITLFHEFGHTLHGLFAVQRYATLSGTNTPVILSNFLPKLMSIGRVILVYSNATRVMLEVVKKCLLIYRKKCARRVYLIKVTI
ncbi:dipeptidyl carboxypeptidase II [Salmonella enterica subsp. arizonae]|uniref:Dipeptidyl carboxypeptidase II n=1 Tax=Salmonella enterica subsp. arizonae TaxID=59203 RepID=A0A379SK13_SALER|nr:dipeptidyl carboxypeptidase II [Salmonella enterica subsp. arizonae]